jgi:hypothetical protein
MQERGKRHAERVASLSERVVGHVETMEPGAVLESIDEVEKFDRMARRTYGLDNAPPGTGAITLSILSNQAAVQIVERR